MADSEDIWESIELRERQREKDKKAKRGKGEEGDTLSQREKEKKAESAEEKIQKEKKAEREAKDEESANKKRRNEEQETKEADEKERSATNRRSGDQSAEEESGRKGTKDRIDEPVQKEKRDRDSTRGDSSRRDSQRRESTERERREGESRKDESQKRESQRGDQRRGELRTKGSGKGERTQKKVGRKGLAEPRSPKTFQFNRNEEKEFDELVYRVRRRMADERPDATVHNSMVVRALVSMALTDLDNGEDLLLNFVIDEIEKDEELKMD